MWHQYLFAAFFIYAGISHFRNPRFFLSITPNWVPFPGTINVIVGILEILFGTGLLIYETEIVAAWGIILLLIAVFPANVKHFQKARKKNRNVLLTLIRLPLQLMLIWWAYQYTLG